MTIHVVQAGETVGSIAESYGVDPARLAADNAVPPSGALAVGQTLVVRFPRQVHAVRAGETLASIAEAYGTTVRRLWQNNWPLGGGAALQPGQVLVISYFDEPLGAAAFNGYAYPYIDMSLLDAELPYLTYLTPFTYGITADGDLLQLEDDALLSAARQRGVRPVMHLSTMTETGQFDTQRATLVLTDSAVQDRLVDQVQQTLRRRGYAGLDVDFEFLPGQLAAAYAAFLARLRRLLNSQGFFLWAALAPKTSARQAGLLYEGHDYAAVGAAVDGVLLMTYEWGHAYSPPMAVAPVDQVRRVVEYAVSRIDPAKINLGIPNYGYDWTLPFTEGAPRARTIGNIEAVQQAVEKGAEIYFDETAQAPYYFYVEDGVTHEVWFEDVRSISSKFALIEEFGLLGAGYWQLMRLFRANWILAAETFHIEGSSM